jgi:DNA-binding IclR family transcriptional regulator
MWKSTLPRPPVATPAPPLDTGVGVLDRAIAIIDAVDRGAVTLAEVTVATGISRTTAHRLLRSLERHAFLTRDRDAGYRLGPHLGRLARETDGPWPWQLLAHGPLARLADATGESAQLYVREGDARICVEAVESSNELRTSVPVGARLPLTAGSAGKVFLTWMAAADRERLVAQAVPLTRTTPTGKALAAELAAIRDRGWASSAGEREEGVGSISVPILGDEDRPLAVVSISGPVSRVGGTDPAPFLGAVGIAALEIGASAGV